jgi:hypothetical protein
MASNPGSVNDTLLDLSDLIVFAAYAVQYEGQVLECENEFVGYEHDLM